MTQLGTVVLFGCLAGIDNFQAACALGLLPLKRKWFLAFAFGLCEFLLSLAGLFAGNFVRTGLFVANSRAGMLALLVSGLVILYLGMSDRDASVVADSRWFLFGLPLSFSLDNLVAGAGLGVSGCPIFLCAAIIGAVSTAMSLAGLFLGSWWRGLFPRRAAALSGAWLVIIAVHSFVK